MSGRYPDRFHASFGDTSRSSSTGSVSGGGGCARPRSPLSAMSELEQIQVELAEAERKLEMMKRQRRRPQPLPHPNHHMRSPPSQHGARHIVSTPVHVHSPSVHHHQQQPHHSHPQQQHHSHPQQQQQRSQHVIISPKGASFAHLSSADPLLAARAMAMAHSTPSSVGHRLPSLPSTPDCVPRSATGVPVQSPLRQHSTGGSGSESPSYVMQLSASVQQRAAQIGHLQEELGSFLKTLRPTIPPQYSWSTIPVEQSHQLGAMLGLEDTVQHVLGASSPAARQSLERRYAQLAGSNKPLCQHCGSDHATFWRAFVDEIGRQVIVCEACDWRRVQTPFVQQYHKVVSGAAAKAETRRHEILQLVRLQQREDRMLHDEHVRLQTRQ